MESRGPVPAIEYRRLESDVESMAIPVGDSHDRRFSSGITGHFHFPTGCGGGGGLARDVTTTYDNPT